MHVIYFIPHSDMQFKKWRQLLQLKGRLVHIMCVASSINILRFVMIGQKTPLVTLASDWLKVSANSSPM